ncbi:alpha/beta hydrolase [Thalassiella azotivora]
MAWRDCGPGLEAFDCATVQVPLDHDDPTGPTTSIALTRLPASDPQRRVGSLFTNPGGPGGSGVDFVQTAAPFVYTPEVLARFDVVGFDPRGVGASDPATCYRTAEQEAVETAGLPAFPVGEAQEHRFIGQNARLGTSCTLTSPDRFSHASTANVARDLDLLRQAVGDDRLTYAGYSYGTFLGATYARLFPDRVRALVLDGPLDPVAYTGADGDPRSVGARIGQGPAASETFGEFLRTCGQAGPAACPLAALGDPSQVSEAVLDRLRREPVVVEVPGAPPVVVDYPLMVVVMFQSMYSPVLWPDLAATFAMLATAPGPAAGAVPASSPQVASLLAAAREPADQQGLQTRPRRGEEYPSLGGSLASLCADVEQPLAPRDFPAMVDDEAARAPHFGRLRAWAGIQCEFLRVDDEDAWAGPWDQALDVPVLVIGTRFDPATPYWMAEPFAARFPDARVVTMQGWGHPALGQSSCTDRVIERYLLELRATDGVTCPTDLVPFAPLPAAAETEQRVLRQALPD